MFCNSVFTIIPIEFITKIKEFIKNTTGRLQNENRKSYFTKIRSNIYTFIIKNQVSHDTSYLHKTKRIIKSKYPWKYSNESIGYKKLYQYKLLSNSCMVIDYASPNKYSAKVSHCKTKCYSASTVVINSLLALKPFLRT